MAVATRTVIMDEKAVQRAEDYIDDVKNNKGIRLTIGAVFALALDKMLEAEKTPTAKVLD
jgi:hypothetical protein